MEDFEFRKLSHFACVGDLDNFKINFDKANLKIYYYGNGGVKDTFPHIAARCGRLSILKFLLDKCGIKYMEAENAEGKTCLHEASQHGHYECVSYLLDVGCNVDALKRADWTPLMLACTKTNLNIIENLVDRGANLNLINKDGWTCLHIACREGNEDIVAYLLSKNSKLANIKSKNGRTPLHTAVLHGRYSVTDLLLKNGDFTCTEIDSCGTTPVMDALRSGNITCAVLLMRHNKSVDLRQRDANGRQAIHLAAEADQIKSIKFLMDLNITVDERTAIGNTALHIASRTLNRLNLYYENPITTVVSILRNSTFLYPILTVCGSVKGGTNEMEKYLLDRQWSCSGPKEKKFWEKLTPDLSQIWSMTNISQDFNVRSSLTSINGQTVNVKSQELSTIFGSCASLALDVPVKPHPPSVYKLFITRAVIKTCSDKPKVLIHTDVNYAKSMFLETTSFELPHSVSGRLVLSAKQFKLVNSSNNPCYRDSERAKCFYDCVVNATNETIVCKFPFMDSVPVFQHLPYCSGAPSTSEAYATIIETYRQINPDSCKCPKICDEVLYTSSLFIDEKLANQTLIVVEVSDTNIEFIEQKLTYDLISLLCDIGGNLSLYIGVCLLVLKKIIMLACLQTKYIFGVKDDIKSNVHFIDDHTLVYPSGINVVVYHIDHRTQNFIPPHPKGRGMTCLAVGPDRTRLAIAEKGEQRAIINIYDPMTRRRLKTLVSSEAQCKEYVSMAFASDGKHFIAQGGAPDWILTFWLWEKNRLLGTICSSNLQTLQPVKEVIFHPFDHLVVCAIGPGVFRCMKFSEGSFKYGPVPKADGITFTCAHWVNEDRIIAGTDSGEIILIDHFEVKSVIVVQKMVRVDANQEEMRNRGDKLEELPEYQILPLNSPVNFIQSYTKGLFVSCGSGCVYFFEKVQDEKETTYRQTKMLSIPQDPLCADPTRPEEQICSFLTISPGEELCVVSTNQLQLFLMNLTTFDIYKSFQVHFDFLVTPFHSKSIVDLDICIRKPLAVTCSADNSIRLWNYETNMEILHKEFSEEVLCIAIHPAGYILIVGFNDRVRLMTVLIDDLKMFKEINLKTCRIATFSHGGHLFTAMQGNVIQVYSAITFELVQSLKGHHTKVTSLAWTYDDSSIVSCGVDGAVYEWGPITGKRTSDSVIKGCHYLCVTVTPDNKAAVAISDDKVVREISESQVIRQVSTNEVLTQVVLSRSGRYLFISTGHGSIWSVKFPLASFAGDLLEYHIHSAPITKLKMESEYQMRLKDMKYADKMRDMTERFTNEMDALRQKLQAAEMEKDRIVMQFDEEMRKTTDKFSHEADETEALCNHKLILEYEKYQELQEWSSQVQLEFESKLEDLEKSKEQALEELTEFYENKLRDKVGQLDMAREQSQSTYLEQEEVKKQIEEDTDREILDTKIKYEKKLKEEKDSNMKLKGEAALLKKKFITMQKEIDDQKMNIQKGVTEQLKLQGVIKSLEKDIGTLKKEINERDGTIQDKENKIYDLKKKNQELEKFKFVLDYKIKELKKQLEPKDNDIREMKEQVSAMEVELNRFRLDNEKLELEINELKQKLRVLDKEMREERIKAIS
uniref:WD repeat-containing protein 55 homolog n=1 Tax=Strigamia maritima TaxID=126957 RepID=T1J5P9_STRMM